MRLIKLALISFLFLFGVATAVSLLIPSSIRISRAVNLDSVPPAFALILDTSRWKEWHPAFMNDSLQRHFPITVNLQNRTDSSITMQLRQGNRMPVANGWLIHSYTYADSVTLQWYMDFRLKWYPWQKFSSLFYENTYGAMMEEGLTNLKNLAEYPPK